MQITRRYKAILKVNEVARERRTTVAIFRGMCTVLSSMVPCDLALLSLYNPDSDDLQIVNVYGPRTDRLFQVGQHLSRDSTQTGWAFEHKSTMFRRDLLKESKFSLDKAAMSEGYVSVCAVPLLVWGDSIGVVTVAAARKNRLSAGHTEIVEEMSNQIALAINSGMLRCSEHANAKLVCPKCLGAAGGKATVFKHRESLSNWGKKGGRGRKKSNVS